MEEELPLEERIAKAVEERLTTLVEKLKTNLGRPQQEWLSISQAAQVVSLSGTHIRRAIVGGMLPASNVGTPDRPTYRIHRNDLNAWMEKRKHGALPTPRRKRKAEPRPMPRSPHFRPPEWGPAFLEGQGR